MSGQHIITFRLSDAEYRELESISKASPVLEGTKPPSTNLVARALMLEALAQRRKQKEAT